MKSIFLETAKNMYCVVISKYRLYQGIALYYSLMSTTQDVQLAVLCMDEETRYTFEQIGFENVTVVPLKNLITPALEQLRQMRNINEFCWTLKPVFLEYILRNNNSIKRVTYLDADLFFFSDMSKVLNEGNYYSILLSLHDIPRENKYIEEMCGKYNSGFISFKRDSSAIKGLKWWENKCLTWCYERLETGKFGDQRYLERLPALFNYTGEVKMPGFNIAPWNQSKYVIQLNNDEVYVNEHKLICYHFSGFRFLGNNEFAITIGLNLVPHPVLYKPYLNALEQAVIQVKKVYPEFNGYFIENNRIKNARLYKSDML